MQVGDPILAEDLVVARLTSVVTLATSSTTLQDVTGLVAPVVANAVYIVEAAVFVLLASGTTEDVKVGFTFPSGAALRLGAMGGTTGGVAAGASTDMNVVFMQFTSGSSAVAFGASTAGTMALLTGTLVMGSTAGNLQAQAAQNTSGGNAVSIRDSSYIRLTRIA